MIEACPNLSDPEVARVFNEIKDATSEKTAYNIWSLNNGYGIDKAPNGAESILFKSLLSECNGDRRAAIRAKAALYGNNFRDWFGDWTHSHVQGVYKTIQDNGKIRLSLESHTDEHPRQIVIEPQGENKYYVHLRIWDGEKVPGNISQEDKQKLFESLYKELPDGAEILFPKSGEGYYATRGTVAALQRLSRDDRFEKGNESGVLKYTDKDGSIKEYEGTSFIKKPSVSKVVDKNGEPLIVYHGTNWDFDTFNKEARGSTTGASSAKLAFFAASNYKNAKAYLVSEEERLVRYTNSRGEEGFYDIFEDILNKNADDIMYAQYLKEIELGKLPLFQIDELKNPYGEGYILSKFVFPDLQEKYPEAAQKYLEEMQKIEDHMLLKYHPHVKIVFLNIRNIKETDDQGKKFNAGSYTGTIDKAIKENRDGGVIRNTKDPLDTDVYYFFEENQIKSAIKNREIEQPGTGFSRTDDSIYEHKSRLSILKPFLEWARKTLDNAKNIDKALKEVNSASGSKFGKKEVGGKVSAIFPFATNGFEFREGSTSRLFEEFIDLEKPASPEELNRLWQLLESKFKNQVRLVRVPEMKDGTARSTVKNGVIYVYVPQNMSISYTTLAEELLHPIMYTIQKRSPKLFEKFLNECKDSNDPHIKLIKSTVRDLYKDEDEAVRDNELVTQSLAYMLKNTTEKKNSLFEQIVEALCKILNEFGLANIVPGNFTLRHLAYALKFEALQLEVEDMDREYDHIGRPQEYEDAAAEAIANMPAVQAAYDIQRENYINSNSPQTEDERKALARQFDLEEMAKNTTKVVEYIARGRALTLDQSTGLYESNRKEDKYIVMLLNNMQKRLSDPKFAPVEAKFLNDTIIKTDDISTMIMQMAKIYIEDFYQADAIQEVLKIIDPEGKMHMGDLVDTLRDMVVKAVLDPSSTEFGKVKQINNNILNFIRRRFNQHTISEEAKLILIDTIAKNMSCCEDLQRTNTEDLLHDVKWYEITGKESQVTPKDIINAIRKGVKTQIKALRSVTNVDETKIVILNQMLAKLDDIDLDNNPDDVLGVVADFISDGMQDINKANADLREMLNLDPAQIDDSRLYQIKTDVVGYYRSIINNYIIPFTRNTTNSTLQPGGALYSTITSILDKCTHTQQLYDYVLRLHVEALINNFVDSNVNIGDKERFKVNCKLWLHNKVNNGDLGFFENWVKSAVSSHSPVVRMIDAFVREYETAIRQDSLQVGRKLQNLYRKSEPALAKLSPFNYQRNFCELDDDGQTTGNFVAEVNVGQFEKEKKAFINEWVEKGKVIIQEDGTLEFPDDKAWKEFNDAYDDFLEGKQHRRYTADYYKLEREYMSRDTIEYKRNIQKRIQLLYDKCYDKEIGAPNIWKLDRPDRQNLQDLFKLQQNLSNPYIITYDSNGKIDKIEEKIGDQLRMAREIAAFNRALAGRISFTPNYKKYNDTKEAIKAKFGENSNEYKTFVYYFSTREVTPLYYSILRDILGPRSNQIIKNLDEVNHKIKSIINATISKKGRYVQDLSKMSDAAYAELKRLEEQKLKLLDNAQNGSRRRLTEEEKEQLNSMHRLIYVTNPQTGIPVINELESQYKQQGKYQEFLNKYFAIGENSVKPLSIFLYDQIDPKYIDEEAPIGMFSEVDMTSEFIDPEYNPEDDEFMNIDKTRYHNSKFDEIMSDPSMKKFYTEMLKTMDEAWAMLPDINRHYKYMLPQRRGNISQLAARDIINAFTGRKGRQKSTMAQVAKNVVKLVAAGAIGGLALGLFASLTPWLTLSTALVSGAGYGIITGFIAGLLTRDKNISDQLLSITENDVQFNESFAIRPDGSEVETIPIRWVKRLDDPTAISTSLIHSITSFYEMALNYKQKEKLAPILENIQFELSGGFNGSSSTDQAERVRSYKSAMVYGRRKTGLARRTSNKMTQSEQKISKLVQFVLDTTHAKMLPWNGTSIYKNMIDSTFSMLSLITSMKQLTPQDLAMGIIYMGKEIFNGTAFTNIGSANTSSFTGAAMQYNGVHMGISDTFDDTEKYWLRRIISRFLSMGPFALIDYTFKGLFTNMVYNTYRLVLDPSTGEEKFMNKQEAQFAYAEYGGRKEGLKRWKKSKITLRNAYSVTENGLELKPEYEKLVRPNAGDKSSYKLETRVSGLIKEQSAVVNGMLDEQDINKVSQNFVGASILLMRGWMVSQLIDYNKDGQDFAVFASNTEDINTLLFSNKTLGSLQSKFIGSLNSFVVQSAPSELEGQYNFATGFIERGWWVGWSKMIKNILQTRELTRHNKYQLRYLAMILLTTISLGLATHPLYNWRESSDEAFKKTDPYNIERVASNFFYTGTVAAYSERFGQVGPLGFSNSLLELVNSPTVASSYIKDLNSIVDASQDLFVLFDSMLQGEDVNQTEPMQVVNRGSFKGRTKLTKDLLKASTELPGVNALGVTNMYKTISPEAEKEKLKFYQKTIPMPELQPWVKLPQKKTKSSKSITQTKVINKW